jgi:ubiquinone/menaquinone biosynthesis C-methylase UbiE
MLARLRERADRQGITNVRTHLTDMASATALESGSFDRAWIVTVLGEIFDPESALGHLYRVLKPGGVLSISELLPDPHYQPRKKVLSLAQSAGFEPAGHWHNFLAYTQNFAKTI